MAMLSWTSCPGCGLDFEVLDAPVCPRCGARALTAAVHREDAPPPARAGEGRPPQDLLRRLARLVCLLATVAFVLEVATAVGASAMVRVLRGTASGDWRTTVPPGEVISYVPGPQRQLLGVSVLCILGVLLWLRARATHGRGAGEPHALAATLAAVLRQLWERDGAGGRLLVVAGSTALAGWPLLGALAMLMRVRVSLAFSCAELALSVASALAYALTVWRLERGTGPADASARS